MQRFVLLIFFFHKAHSHSHAASANHDVCEGETCAAKYADDDTSLFQTQINVKTKTNDASNALQSSPEANKEEQIEEGKDISLEEGKEHLGLMNVNTSHAYAPNRMSHGHCPRTTDSSGANVWVAIGSMIQGCWSVIQGVHERGPGAECGMAHYRAMEFDWWNREIKEKTWSYGPKYYDSKAFGKKWAKYLKITPEPDCVQLYQGTFLDGTWKNMGEGQGLNGLWFLMVYKNSKPKVRMETKTGDAAYIDFIQVETKLKYTDPKSDECDWKCKENDGSWTGKFKQLGRSGYKGWCLSTDKYDAKAWSPTYVESGLCYKSMSFKTDGDSEDVTTDAEEDDTPHEVKCFGTSPSCPYSKTSNCPYTYPIKINYNNGGTQYYDGKSDNCGTGCTTGWKLFCARKLPVSMPVSIKPSR